MPKQEVCEHCFNAKCQCRNCRGNDPECYFRNECAFNPEGELHCNDKLFFPDKKFPLRG